MCARILQSGNYNDIPSTIIISNMPNGNYHTDIITY